MTDMRKLMMIVERSFNTSQTETPEFRRWFGNSKVVDSQGKPLIVYHGTDGDFSSFNADGGKAKTHQTGAFFSANPATASTYASGHANIKPVYLSIQHPAIIDAKGKNWNRLNKKSRISTPSIEVSDQEDEDLLAALLDREPKKNASKKLKARNTTLGKMFPDEMRYVDDFTSTDDMARWARKQGYDGLIIQNVSDHGPSGMYGSDAARVPSNLYVAFRPQQIKSAIGNAGGFDMESPNISEEIVLSETIEELDVFGSNVKVFVNPSPQQFLSILERDDQLRGFEHDNEIYVWDGHKAVHYQIEDCYGFPNKECSEFSVYYYEMGEPFITIACSPHKDKLLNTELFKKVLGSIRHKFVQ